MAASEKMDTDPGGAVAVPPGSAAAVAAASPSASPAPAGASIERFDEILVRLRGVVEKLEGGNLSLEDSLKFFEEGIGLCRRGATILDSAERKVEVLLGGSPGQGRNSGNTDQGERGDKAELSSSARTVPFDVPAGDED